MIHSTVKQLVKKFRLVEESKQMVLKSLIKFLLSTIDNWLIFDNFDEYEKMSFSKKEDIISYNLLKGFWPNYSGHRMISDIGLDDKDAFIDFINDNISEITDKINEKVLD